MSILDKIRGAKQDEKKTAKVERLKAVKVGNVAKKTEKRKANVAKKEASQKTKAARERFNFAYRQILSTLVTEKSTLLGQFNKYAFKVHPQANKHTVKSAIEEYYGVRVTKVNIVKIHPKTRIQGRTLGYKKGYKKAIVTLIAGDTISTVGGA